MYGRMLQVAERATAIGRFEEAPAGAPDDVVQQHPVVFEFTDSQHRHGIFQSVCHRRTNPAVARARTISRGTAAARERMNSAWNWSETFSLRFPAYLDTIPETTV